MTPVPRAGYRRLVDALTRRDPCGQRLDDNVTLECTPAAHVLALTTATDRIPLPLLPDGLRDLHALYRETLIESDPSAAALVPPRGRPRAVPVTASSSDVHPASP